MDEMQKDIIDQTDEGEAQAQNEEELNTEEQCERDINISDTERSYTGLQTLFAWVSMIFGYLFCRVFWVVSNPLGGLCFVVALFAVTSLVLKKQGAVFSKITVISIVAALTVSATLFVSSNAMLQQVSYVFALATYGYFVCSATGNTLQKGFSNFILVDYFKALAVLPFCAVGNVFKAMFYGKASSSGAVLGKLLAGILIAIVPTFTVAVLLSYDDGFSKLLGDIFNFEFLDVASHILSIFFGIPVGMYIFSLFLSSSDGDKATNVNVENVQRLSQFLNRMPSVTAVAASLPLIFLYVVFFISQWKYYISGFKGVLPDDQSYANYAREGFFQLCTVSVINLIAIIVLSVFMKRNQNGQSLFLKLLSVTFSVFTLVLISTAIAKMIMYIDRFGLTPKRVYASWFMILLAVIFILVIIKQFVKNFKVIIASVGACVLLFCVLSLSNVDGLIAKYNVDRYLNGSLNTVDVGALDELGNAGIPEMIRLAKELDKELGTDISDCVKNGIPSKFENPKQSIYNELVARLSVSGGRLNARDDGIFAYDLQRYRAEKAFESIGIYN